ncbi:PIN domain-containing protein [Brachyspira intermedia]|uniref:PIN domain-containing protein n=1 Tax=Brachyspira intermedia TaxID=84377 RepID=UPI003005201E
MNNRICCLLDTCALSFLLEEESKLNESEKEWYNSFELIKNKIDIFVISSLVMHELSLNINIPESKDNNLVLKKIFNFFKCFFGIDKVEIIELNEDSITEYRNLYKNTNFLIECQCDSKMNVCRSKKYKHKIDALIVAQASAYANNLYNNGKYSEFWLLTEDKNMKKYKTDNLKIYSFKDAKVTLGIEDVLPL